MGIVGSDIQNSPVWDCLAALLLFLVKSRISSGVGVVKAGRRPPRSGFQALTTSSPTYPSGDEGQRFLVRNLELRA